MLIRPVFLCKYFLLSSDLYSNVTTEAIATLNHINFGALTPESFRLVLRHYMRKNASKIMSSLILFCWVSVAWVIRLAEARYGILNCCLEKVNYTYLDMLWLVPITMTTIGYGDMSPKSSIGKIFALLIGFFGIVASAVLVGMCTGILTMTRRERLIHNVLENDQKRKELTTKAAIVLQRIWRRYKSGGEILKKNEIGSTRTLKPELAVKPRVAKQVSEPEKYTLNMSFQSDLGKYLSKDDNRQDLTMKQETDMV